MSTSRQTPRRNEAEGSNEGEGNRSADRRYREGVGETVRSGQFEEKAREAAKALEGPEGPGLRRAEAAARRGRPARPKRSVKAAVKH